MHCGRGRATHWSMACSDGRRGVPRPSGRPSPAIPHRRPIPPTPPAGPDRRRPAQPGRNEVRRSATDAPHGGGVPRAARRRGRHIGARRLGLVVDVGAARRRAVREGARGPRRPGRAGRPPPGPRPHPSVQPLGTDRHRRRRSSKAGSRPRAGPGRGYRPRRRPPTTARSSSTPGPPTTSTTVARPGAGRDQRATAGHGGQRRRQVLGQQNEHGRGRRLLERLEQRRGRPIGQMHVGDDHHLAAASKGRRWAWATTARAVHVEAGARPLDDDHVGMHTGHHPATESQTPHPPRDRAERRRRPRAAARLPDPGVPATGTRAPAGRPRPRAAPPPPAADHAEEETLGGGMDRSLRSSCHAREAAQGSLDADQTPAATSSTVARPSTTSPARRVIGRQGAVAVGHPPLGNRERPLRCGRPARARSGPRPRRPARR